MQHGQEHPMAYSSRQLTKAEIKYSTTEKEALAVIDAIKHFRHYLLNKPFEIISDHRPLQWPKNQKDNNGRLASIQPVPNNIKLICEKELEDDLCVAIRNYSEKGELNEENTQSKPEWAKEIEYFEIIEGKLYRREVPSKNRIERRRTCKLGKYVDDVLFAYRSSVHSSTLETPYYLVHGRDPNISINEFLDAYPQILNLYPTINFLVTIPTAAMLLRVTPTGI
ncbi:Uncharacterized protein APZ42_033808 [Daphnia magna]|uniref:Reverse transcriptase RNase H-like domain-containing protein n=1 Tax=Daphnia magna TaxID=35525 RepID=A0A164KQ59_9CRUS|nr:Uncharacterized protein APZ42_033808 [Daphnia magna]